jgi:hypothetical protein
VKEDFHFSELFSLLNSELQHAKNEVFFASPYTKTGIVKKLEIPNDISSQVIFVCRWKLDDILSGATDIGVYPLLKDQGVRVLLHPNLHAKYYRFDNRILTGSANLTSNGLLNDENGSLEALTVLARSQSTRNFESKILQESIEVDDELYSEYFEFLDAHTMPVKLGEVDVYWPSFASFEEAWSIYKDDQSSINLKPLGFPPALEKHKLKKFMKLRLKEFSNINRIEKFLTSGIDGRRFGEVRALIREMDQSIDETSAWQNLMSLLLDLYPERYEYFRPNHTEIIFPKGK